MLEVDDATSPEHPRRMMRRRSGGYGNSGPGPIGAAARSLLVFAFGLAVVVSPLAMITCPHHGVPSAASTVAADRGHPQSAVAAPHDESGNSDSRDHDHGTGPCCCLGQCCPGGSISHPAPDASGALPYTVETAGTPAFHDAVGPTADPWLLPWPNGPPVLS